MHMQFPEDYITYSNGFIINIFSQSCSKKKKEKIFSQSTSKTAGTYTNMALSSKDVSLTPQSSLQLQFSTE